MTRLLAGLLLGLVAACGGGRSIESADLGSAAGSTTVERTLARLHDANSHRDSVMLMAHRGLWMYNGEQHYPEQSRASIEVARAAGIEGVELDVRVTRDGQFVILHDDTLDRTTSCTGSIRDFDWHELRDCRLTIVRADGSRLISDESIVTLEEAYALAKDHLLINLDNKIGNDYYPALFELAIEYEVDHQILASVSMNTRAERQSGYALVAEWQNSRINFMPVITDAAYDFREHLIGLRDDYAVFEEILQTVRPTVVQVLNAWSAPQNPTQDGGFFFTQQASALCETYNTHRWMNTLYADPAGRRSGGRGDEKAVAEGQPDEVWGWWYRAGVTLFQTDEPQLASDFLVGAGYRTISP
ncbi:MAG: glycerophosphodiester phosphodiesterase family protein [Oceanococcus sp.]|nr:MAG: glycerophosphodiester phosphodiesterase family protein [Oceanococcus sp.]